MAGIAARLTGAAVAALADRVCAVRASAGAARVALSGIDASGKGTLAAVLAGTLERRGKRVAVVGLDDWHRAPEERFGGPDPGARFYERGFDFDALFDLVLDPLRREGGVRLALERPHPFTGEPRRLEYAWSGVDVVVVEGLFLLRRDLATRWDLRVWIECPFEVALERALRRNQEGMLPERLAEDYRRVYFPAQRLHLGLDRPEALADVVLDNGGDA